MNNNKSSKAQIKAPRFLTWKTLKSRVKTTSRPDQRNNSTMINKSTKESQSIAQISANTQPNNKAFKNREEQERKTSKNHFCSAKLISPNSDLVSKIRPVRMKSNESRTCCKNFSAIQRWTNPQCRIYCDNSMKNVNKIFPLPLPLCVRAFSVFWLYCSVSLFIL